MISEEIKGSMINPCNTCIARRAESDVCDDCNRCLAHNYNIVGVCNTLISEDPDYYENNPNAPALESDDMFHASKRIHLILNCNNKLR